MNKNEKKELLRMEYKEILLMKELHPDTEELVSVSIVGMVKASSYLIAKVTSFIEAHEWAKQQNTMIRTIDEYAQMDGNQPVVDLFESELYTKIEG